MSTDPSSSRLQAGSEPIETVLIDQIRARRWQFRASALLILGLSMLGTVAFVVGFLDPTDDRRSARAVALSFLGFPLAAGLFLSTLRDPRKNTVIAACLNEPANVVWHYVSSPAGRPAWSTRPGWRWAAAESTLVVGLASGKMVRLPVRFGDEDRVSAALAAALPAATVGFSSQRQAQYAQNPASLRRTTA